MSVGKLIGKLESVIDGEYCERMRERKERGGEAEKQREKGDEMKTDEDDEDEEE